MSRPPRILFVAMHHSIHTARWIDMIADFGFELHMYALDAGEPNHKLRGLTLHRPVAASPAGEATPILPNTPAVTIISRMRRFAGLAIRHPGQGFMLLKKRLARLQLFAQPQTVVSTQPEAAAPEAIITRLVPVNFGQGAHPDQRIRTGLEGESAETIDLLHGPATLAEVIAHVQPDLIHSMEFQHAGYLVLAARDLMRQEQPHTAFPRWLATNWGSDIYHFGKDPGHSAQIKRMCEVLDLYSCECQRDLYLGIEYGYKGPQLPVLPNSGGMDMAHMLGLRSDVVPSRRKIIMVKGYDHFAGRAMISLAVLEKFAKELKGYKIILFSVGARPRVRAMELAAAGVLDIEVVDWATHDDILRFFGQARMYLGVSISDAISTSVLESMVMGAFPVQTNSSCGDEWFIDGKTGFAVDVNDFDMICDRFGQALRDDALVENAAKENFDIIRSRIATDVIRPRIKGFYSKALEGLPCNIDDVKG